MLNKCLNCGNQVRLKQHTYCSRRCMYDLKIKLNKEKQHFCFSCNTPINQQLSKRWICYPCKREKENAYYLVNGDKKRATSRITSNARNKRIRLIVLENYGGKCNCCNEDRQEFLAIDHVNGGGQKHRRSIGGSIYNWLFKHGFPKKEYRILCHNCNCSRGYYGYCPHEKIKN